jgi:hypothetical protein
MSSDAMRLHLSAGTISIVQATAEVEFKQLISLAFKLLYQNRFGPQG